jgi:hypothetical protein
MSTPQSIVEAQTDALLRRVSREQETRSRHARESAEEQARGILQRAWAEARARLRQAVLEERRSVEQTLADRRAALETDERQRSQSALRAVLDEAWQSLPAALDREWSRADSRQRWCRAACSSAVSVLEPTLGWTLEIDADADAGVEEAALAAVSSQPGEQPVVQRIAGLGSGIRIRCGRACVDATVAGLLASRERVESELLAEMERLGATDRETPA